MKKIRERSLMIRWNADFEPEIQQTSRKYERDEDSLASGHTPGENTSRNDTNKDAIDDRAKLDGVWEINGDDMTQHDADK